MTMKFHPFNLKTLSTTSEAWIASSRSVEGFAPSLDQLFDWVGKNMEVKPEAHGAYDVAYGVFDETSESAIAICELTVSRLNANSKWVKMLNLRLSPEIEDGIFKNDVASTSLAVNAYVQCILGVFSVKLLHKADTLKVYGRTHEQLSMLTTLASTLNNDTNKLNASIEGRWFVVKEEK